MDSIYTRTKLIYGDKIESIKESTVMVVGIGGVGSYAAEALARTGVGKLILVDKDKIDITNINRQIHALHSTVGKEKVDVMKDRILDINPSCKVHTINVFELNDAFSLIPECDFVIDAIDTITNKIKLIKKCLMENVRFISSMGAGNKVDPTMFQIADISKTEYDPIARIIRQKLRKERVKGKVPVVYSKEVPRKISKAFENFEDRSMLPPPGSNAFVPSVVGLIAASYAIKCITE
ncbi:tRNA threonylcarbamoyladenosine dehydratase [Mycoplasmatota bacterium]|nr:tRNA threonylcarbamoyladenosine dehydratase [Mycoplasmatota bacterium]